MSAGRRLAGFGVRGFRSFGWDEMQYAGPLSAVHMLAGANDSGKSNLLRAIDRTLRALGAGTPLEWDRHLDGVSAGREEEPPPLPHVAIAVRPSRDRFAEAGLLAPPFPYETLRTLFGGPSFAGPGDGGVEPLIWLELDLGADPPAPTGRQAEELARAARASDERDLLGLISVKWCCDRTTEQEDAARVLCHLARVLGLPESLPAPIVVDALRRFDDDHAGGAGVRLPGLLTDLILPGLDLAGAGDRYASITDFVGEVLDEPSIRVKPGNGEHENEIFVEFDDRRPRPLRHLGSGVEQLVVIAALSTDPDADLVLLEEPEAHLHPEMQRRLLRRMHADDSRQYVVATHSPHLLDAERVSISSVAKRAGQSRLGRVARPSEVAAVTLGLGLRASDLVQANAVVWVEGPSDRVYLRHWIERADERLIEGVHYSLVPYGGSLLAWLSAEDEPTADLIALPRLNRNFAVVLDSDSGDPTAPAPEARRRLVELMRAAQPDALIWVTQGCTIEDYVSRDDLERAVATVHPRATLTWSGDMAVNPLGRRQIDRDQPNKLRIAAAVVQAAGTRPGYRSDVVVDVREKVGGLVDMIRRANDLPPVASGADEPAPAPRRPL